MTRFITNYIGPGERIIYSTRLHWIYAVQGVAWLAVMTFIGAQLDYYLNKYFGAGVEDRGYESFFPFFPVHFPLIFGMFAGGGILIFLVQIVKILATEIALTSQRMIYKTGLMFVNVEQIDLTEVRAEQVHHGLLGRFLGYGSLHLDSRFVGDVYLPAIRKPYNLLKAIYAVRQRQKDPLEK